MHELRRYVQEEMDKRNWTQSDVANAGKFDRQVVNAIVRDKRDVLPRIPAPATIDGLSRAFGVSKDTILSRVAQAMGLPVEVRITDISAASNDELLIELQRRLKDVSHDLSDQNDSHPPTPPQPRAPGEADESQKTPAPPLDRLGYDLAALKGERALDREDEAARRRGEESQG